MKTDAQEHETYSCVHTPLAIKQFNVANMLCFVVPREVMKCCRITLKAIVEK